MEKERWQVEQEESPCFNLFITCHVLYLMLWPSHPTNRCSLGVNLTYDEKPTSLNYALQALPSVNKSHCTHTCKETYLLWQGFRFQWPCWVIHLLTSDLCLWNFCICATSTCSDLWPHGSPHAQYPPTPPMCCDIPKLPLCGLMVKVKWPSIPYVFSAPTWTDSNTHQQPSADTEPTQQILTEEVCFFFFEEFIFRLQLWEKHQLCHINRHS